MIKTNLRAMSSLQRKARENREAINKLKETGEDNVKLERLIRLNNKINKTIRF